MNNHKLGYYDVINILEYFIHKICYIDRILNKMLLEKYRNLTIWSIQLSNERGL